jgi:ATP-dependent exoDNAse (exonuclease V) beta subunit
MQTLQIYECSECLYHFTARTPGKNKSYPLKVILDAISTFNLGNSLTDTQRIMRRKAHVEIPARTLQDWLQTYRPLCTYHRLRAAASQLHAPENIIRILELEHCQVYRFQLHRAKLELLLNSPDHSAFAPLREYFRQVENNFPHNLFTEAEHRSSKFPAELAPRVERKENHATRMAELVLPTSLNNRKRHETLQRFMLINDSVTVAVEIPIYLTAPDLAYYRCHKFALDFDAEVVTGHIDLLQIRNGHLHVLDYKPEARKETHAHVQLTIYALALARRTGLPLKLFKCAWFDEKDYFEFYPLTGVSGLASQAASEMRKGPPLNRR